MGASTNHDDEANSAAAVKNGEIQSRKVVQLVLLSHGLGVLIGFGLFVSLYSTQCASLLRSKSLDFNTTIEQWQKQCDFDSSTRTIQESTACDSTLLVQQADLIRRHQESLTSHEAALLLISNLQEHKASAKETTANLHIEVDKLQQEIAALTATVEREKRRGENLQVRFQHELGLAKIMMQERADEVQRFRTSDMEESSYMQESRYHLEEVVEIKAAVKSRSMALTTGAFGRALPYTVLFLLESPDQAGSSFKVEIDRLHEMPHSVYTFLSLVQAGLYHGTSLQVRMDTGDVVVTGGSPASSIHPYVQSNLTHRYAEHGWTVIRPLAFNERSTKPCIDLSFGFVNHGPEIEIWLPEGGTSMDQSYTCFGHIVAGRETLVHLDQKRVTIIDARIT